MATHSSIAARKIPWTEEPCGSQSWTSLSTCIHTHTHGFPAGSVVKNLPAMQETRFRSLGQEDTQEKGMVTHCSILAWRFPWTEGPQDLKESEMTERLSL